jgi:hypothetical protein
MQDVDIFASPNNKISNFHLVSLLQAYRRVLSCLLFIQEEGEKSSMNLLILVETKMVNTSVDNTLGGLEDSKFISIIPMIHFSV